MLRRWVPLIAVAALLAAAFVASALAEPQFDVRPLPVPSETAQVDAGATASAQPTATPQDAQTTRPPLFTLPAWIDSVVSTLCLILVIVVGALLAWYVVRNTIQAQGRPITVEEGAPRPVNRAAAVAAALDSGLEQLARDGTDPRSVVIACWVRLEDTAAAAGTPRRPSDAPADYVLRLLAGHQVSRSVLDRLADVYRQARYSAGPVDESMRGAAVAALQHLRAELNVPV